MEQGVSLAPCSMELSILIPSRNEMFLARTIQDILDNSEADTEVIALLDGKWAEPGIPQHEKVNVIYVPESIGQRAGTNMACKLASGKYVMKVDAHCAFDKGFDRKMIDFMEKWGDDVTAVPVMKNLHAFDWVCPDGHRRYQGPSGPCKQCGKETMREMVWKPKANVNSTSYCFDCEPHFQYFEDWKHREPYLTDKKTKRCTETMSLQGSCFMATRDKYWELKLSDEDLGNWGNQGIELACKTWLSGGRVLVNHRTWYAHMFRTQGGDFSFPYQQSGRAVQKCKQNVKELFWNNKYEHQKYPLSWLIEKFWPILWKDKNGNLIGWKEEDLKKLKERDLEFQK